MNCYTRLATMPLSPMNSQRKCLSAAHNASYLTITQSRKLIEAREALHDAVSNRLILVLIGGIISLNGGLSELPRWAINVWSDGRWWKCGRLSKKVVTKTKPQSLSSTIALWPQ